jgi:hypothetical protein
VLRNGTLIGGGGMEVEESEPHWLKPPKPLILFTEKNYSTCNERKRKEKDEKMLD